MAKELSPALQELNNMQLKISYLFLDLMREKNEHKLNSENLNKKLQQLSNEAETLKEQNKILRQNNEDMKNVIEKGIIVFKSLDFSNLNFLKEHKIALETLKTTFFEFNKGVETSAPTSGSTHEEKVKSIEIDSTRYKLSDEEIQKEFEMLSNLNFFANFSFDKTVDENSQKKSFALDRSRSDTVLKSLFQNVSVTKNTKELSSVYENDSFESKSIHTVLDAEIHRTSPPSRETETRPDRSPVFKDFGIRKLDSLSNEDSENSSSTSLPSKLINEKFLEKSDNFVISPWKKSSHQANEKTPSKKSPSSKRTRKKLKINTPERSPCAMLKKSNMREAEISLSGIRKLRQTLLNVDCYKKNNVKECKNNENRENKNFESYIDNIKNKKKVMIADDEDDDFITESPNKADQKLEDIKIKKSETNLNEVPFFTPSQTSVKKSGWKLQKHKLPQYDFTKASSAFPADSYEDENEWEKQLFARLDFDETYISSSLLRKCNATNKRELEKIIQDKTPFKRHAREVSPEYDSVPFVYKREPVRKRAERMKLPGHACLECMKYYENAFGDLGAQDLKKILDKCSRHRDKNSPTNDDTPPGYWKPYLTCSTIISPNTDDFSKAIIN